MNDNETKPALDKVAAERVQAATDKAQAWWKGLSRKGRRVVAFIAISAGILTIATPAAVSAMTGYHGPRCYEDLCSYDQQLKFEEHCQAEFSDYSSKVSTECRHGSYNPVWDKTTG